MTICVNSNSALNINTNSRLNVKAASSIMKKVTEGGHFSQFLETSFTTAFYTTIFYESCHWKLTTVYKQRFFSRSRWEKPSVSSDFFCLKGDVPSHTPRTTHQQWYSQCCITHSLHTSEYSQCKSSYTHRTYNDAGSAQLQQHSVHLQDRRTNCRQYRQYRVLVGRLRDNNEITRCVCVCVLPPHQP